MYVVFEHKYKVKCQNDTLSRNYINMYAMHIDKNNILIYLLTHFLAKQDFLHIEKMVSCLFHIEKIPEIMFYTLI